MEDDSIAPDRGVRSGSNSGGGDLDGLDVQADSSESEQSEGDSDDLSEDDPKCVLTLQRKLKACRAECKRLTKSLKSKTAYVTRLKNQRQLQDSRNAARILQNKTQVTNLSNTLRQERTSRTQLRCSIRSEFTTKIKAAQMQEKEACRRAAAFEKEIEKIQRQLSSARAEVETLNSRLSLFKRDLSGSLRERDNLKKRAKEQDSVVKKLQQKVDENDDHTLGQRLQIEQAKTERAKFEYDAKKNAENKRIKEIEAAHASKMMVLHETVRIKQKEKEDKEKAKEKAAMKKQHDDMKKLDSSFENYHKMATPPQAPSSGHFPGNKALLQSQQQVADLLAQLGGGGEHVPAVASLPPGATLALPSPPAAKRFKKTARKPPPVRYHSQTLTQMENIVPPPTTPPTPPAEEEDNTSVDPRVLDPTLLPPDVEPIAAHCGATVYVRTIGDDEIWYMSLEEMDEQMAGEKKAATPTPPTNVRQNDERQNDIHEGISNNRGNNGGPVAVEILSSDDDEEQPSVPANRSYSDLSWATQSGNAGPNEVTPPVLPRDDPNTFLNRGGWRNPRFHNPGSY